MRKEFTSGDFTVDYELTQAHRKTMVIEIKPDLSIAVKVPRNVNDEQIEAFIGKKIQWIRKHRERYARATPPKPREYINGEIFLYMGRELALYVSESAEHEQVLAQEDRLTVHSKRPRSALYTRQMIDRWYEEEAVRVFTERLEECSRRFGLKQPPPLVIRAMKSRLGSYSTGTGRICLNRKLIGIDQRLIDYVIIHELCHIRHHSHNKAFYFELGRNLPEWKQLEAKLQTALLGTPQIG